MKKMIVILLALVLAGPFIMRADPQDGLTPAETPVTTKPVPAISAFLYLYEIAENARKWRIGAAIPSLIAGSALSIIGLWLWDYGDADDFLNLKITGQITLAGGLLFSSVGILNLSLKSSAERSYNQALKLSAEERDVFCAATLKKESSQAKVGRFVSAGIYSGLTAVILLQASAFGYEPDEFASFVLPYVIPFGIAALYKLVFPSFAERIYRRYLQEKAVVEQSNKLALNFGLVPRGFALGAQYHF